ncbi:hypothetical protein [Flocculibacter collagenilyticus]|uniref:hypothetical protein n=1 Tax=Flocculibacter collagenilyticus TaxID=2744479 RepID=UPI0018F4D734|nr:hypothetical protein [Flocculibacter collagenilyticus]
MKTSTYLATFIAVLIGYLLLYSAYSLANESRESFSTEGYCILESEKVDPNYLDNYVKKLGFRPKRSVCKKIMRLIGSFQPDNWHYKFNRAFPGSAIKLSDNQIEMIKRAQRKHTPDVVK